MNGFVTTGSFSDSPRIGLARRESRGLNYNLDYPQPNPDWSQRDTVLRK